MTRPGQRALLLRGAAALFGLAIGISLLPHFAAEPATAGQLPSFATAHGIDARASFRFFASVVLLILAMPLVLRPAIVRLLGDDTQRWARATAIVSMLVALWFATIDQNPLWTVATGLVPAATALRLCHFRAKFRRGDAILVPVFLTVFMALTDATQLPLPRIAILSAALVFGTRLVVAAIARALPPADAFAAAPLALVMQAHVHSLPVRHLAWPPLLIALGTPFLLRAVVRPQWRQRLRWSIAFIIYPIAVLAFASASSKLAAEGKPHSDLFEDSHRFLPASEMLRGERAYRDIVPEHGFIDDGFLDYLILRTGEVSAGHAAKTHGVISALNSAASYAMAAAATGSSDIGLLSYFLAAIYGTGGGTFRACPALFAVVLIACALRNRKPRLLAYAGALVILAALTSLDFGGYALITLAAAVMLFRGHRMRAAIAASIGFLAAGIVTLIAFAAAGILGAFVKTTLFEVLPIVPLFSLEAFAPPPAIRAAGSLPDALAAIFARPDVFVIAWIAFLILLSILLATPSSNTRRRAPLIALAVFCTAAGVSYAERQHLYFILVLAPLTTASVTLLFRHARALAIAAVIVLVIAAHITAFLVTLTILRKSRGPLEPDLVEITSIPRARGALFRDREARIIDSVNRYVTTRLAANETFFDFTNRGNLYFLLDRDCPIRQVEVAFYEPENLQHEVIDRLERNRNVRAALVPAVPEDPGIDGVPNAVRAPLVWRYLQDHYQPDFAEGVVAIWRRK